MTIRTLAATEYPWDEPLGGGQKKEISNGDTLGEKGIKVFRGFDRFDWVKYIYNLPNKNVIDPYHNEHIIPFYSKIIKDLSDGKSPLLVGFSERFARSIVLGVSRIIDSPDTQDLNHRGIVLINLPLLLADYPFQISKNLCKVIKGAHEEGMLVFIHSLPHLLRKDHLISYDVRQTIMNGCQFIGHIHPDEINGFLEAGRGSNDRFSTRETESYMVQYQKGQSKRIGLEDVLGEKENTLLLSLCNQYMSNPTEAALRILHEINNDRDFSQSSCWVRNILIRFAFHKVPEGPTFGIVTEAVANYVSPIRLFNLSFELALTKEFEKRIIGQNKAIKQVCDALRFFQMKEGKCKTQLPLFLFSGGVGVGKTLMAKLLSDFIFGAERDPCVLDMWEYGTHSTLDEMKDILASSLTNQQGSLVLLTNWEMCDEVAKVFFMSTWKDDGYQDQNGDYVSYSKALFICETNNPTKGRVKKIFDAAIKFKRIGAKDAIDATRVQLNTIRSQHPNAWINEDYPQELLTYLVKKGYSTDNGLSLLSRVIHREVVTKLNRTLYRKDVLDPISKTISGDVSLELKFESDQPEFLIKHK